MTTEESQAVKQLWASVMLRDAPPEVLLPWQEKALHDPALAEMLQSLAADERWVKHLPRGPEPFESLDSLPVDVASPAELVPPNLTRRLEALAEQLGTPPQPERRTPNSWLMLPQWSVGGVGLALLFLLVLLKPWEPEPLHWRGDPQAIQEALARQPQLDLYSAAEPLALETLSNGESGVRWKAGVRGELRLTGLQVGFPQGVRELALVVRPWHSHVPAEVFPLQLQRTQTGEGLLLGLPESLWSRQGLARWQVVGTQQPPLDRLRLVRQAPDTRFGRPLLIPERLLSPGELEAGLWVEVGP